MLEEKLDMRGRACPEPVIATREALEKRGVQSLTVLVDNDAASENVARTGQSLGCEVTVEATAAGEFHVSLLRTKPILDSGQHAANTCTAGQNLVVLIPTDTFGVGDPDLGRALLLAFIGTLDKLSPRPSRLIFLNAGAKLVCDEPAFVDKVSALSEIGCEVLVCGTCLDFYHLDEQLKVGKVSNMMEIASTLASADKVIRP
jgi:selenium metabolism protein YedF